MKQFSYSIFVSAFLLFIVQPMIARYILPWFGGSAAVWSTCMLFFQAGLLIGYGYSHFLTKYFPVKKQVIIHLVLLIISALTLPVAPQEWMKPEGDENPVLKILSLLTLSIGLPYVMVSTTGPLLQYWFSIANPGKPPYRLYALSNLGSLIGLFSYPLIVEPYFGLTTQAWIWSAGYVLFILLCGSVSFFIFKSNPVAETSDKIKPENVSGTTRLLWLLLPLMGVVTLLSGTNKLTQDIIVIPFLWVLPLSLYLVSFIIAFENPKWYKRGIYLILAAIVTAYILYRQVLFANDVEDMSIAVMVVLYPLNIFFICMSLHGELARLKPDKGNLTFFYLMIAMGGVLGGMFISFVAPLVFKGYWEIYCALIGSTILISYVILKFSGEIKQKTKQKSKSSPNTFTKVVSAAFLIGLLIALQREYVGANNQVIARTRNFYGVLRVIEDGKGKDNWQRALIHGSIAHGFQFMDSVYSRTPISYYGPGSGVGIVITRHPSRADANYRGMKIGVIGLGAGAISAYGIPSDTIRYYEINPDVEMLAKKYFTYIEESSARNDVIIGDGRLILEKELKETGGNHFDVLVVDAFSGDYIPTHLITREAVELYFKHLKKDGILAFNITNKYLDMLPVMRGIGKMFNKELQLFHQEADEKGNFGAIWVVITDNKVFLMNPIVVKSLQQIFPVSTHSINWTDDYSSVLSLLW